MRGDVSITKYIFVYNCKGIKYFWKDILIKVVKKLVKLLSM